MKLYLVVIIGLILTSCNDDSIIINDILFSNGEIVVTNDTIPLSHKRSLNANYSLSVGDTLLKAGGFLMGQVDGRWVYNLSSFGKGMYDVVWCIYDGAVNISLPCEWKVLKSPESPIIFMSYFDLEEGSGVIEDNYLAIVEGKGDESVDLDYYNLRYRESIVSFGGVNDLCAKISTHSASFYYNRSHELMQEGTKNIFNINTKFGGVFYEITMVSSSSELVKNQLLFFEMFRSLKIMDKQLLPFEGYLEMVLN